MELAQRINTIPIKHGKKTEDFRALKRAKGEYQNIHRNVCTWSGKVPVGFVGEFAFVDTLY